MSARTKLDLPAHPVTIGYARVSTPGQDVERQRRALKAARCFAIVEDIGSGKSMKARPNFTALLGALAPGDCLIVAEWDRATRSMWDGMEIVRAVAEAGATIKILDFPSLDMTTPEGRGFLAMFSAIAERERMRIRHRTHEGRKIAQAKGQRMGRKPTLSEERKLEARRMLVEDKKTRAQVAKIFNVSKRTIDRIGE